MSATSDIVIRERRSPAATATIFGACFAAAIACLVGVGWFAWQSGYDERDLEVTRLAEEAKRASEDANRAADEKREALAEAAKEQTDALQKAQKEKSLAIREVEAKATELLSTTSRDRNRLQVENEVLREKVLLLESERDSEREETARIKGSLDSLQRQLQIDKAAYEELKVALSSSSDNLGSLRDELNFYRSILSPEGEKTGVQVQGLELKTTGIAHQFQYRITLIQARKHEKNVRGKANLELEGSQDGIRKIVDVGIFGEAPEPINFKYYQHFSGVFDLPPDFVPTGARVVVSGGGLAKNVEQWYPWPSN